jgi:hypothetical protein
MEYIDINEVARLWGFASRGAVTNVISRCKKKHPEYPFPKPDLIIDQKYFWSEDSIPAILAWRRMQARGELR